MTKTSLLSLRRLRRNALVAGLLLAQLGCLETVELQRLELGLIRAEAVDDNGTAALSVRGVFISVADVTIGVGTPESCVDLPFSAASDDADAPTVDAGPALTATVGGSSQVINRRTQLGRTDYPTPLSGPLPYTPGDTLRVAVPGAVDGFPSTELVIRTAEVLVADPIVPPSTPGGSMPISWTPAPVAGSVVTTSLRYSSGEIGGGLRQIYCVFLDDGASAVPASYLTPYLAAPEESRTNVLSRVRYTEQLVEGRTRIVAYSFYQLPLPGGVQ